MVPRAVGAANAAGLVPARFPRLSPWLNALPEEARLNGCESPGRASDMAINGPVTSDGSFTLTSWCRRIGLIPSRKHRRLSALPPGFSRWFMSCVKGRSVALQGRLSGRRASRARRPGEQVRSRYGRAHAAGVDTHQQ